MMKDDNASLRRRLFIDQAGDGRLSSFLAVVSVFFIGLMVIAVSTDPVVIGVNKGEMPPNITGEARIAHSDWFSFDLYAKFNGSWNGNITTDRWFVIEFMDTDCPYCWRDAETMSQIDAQFGGVIITIVVATELNLPGHESSRKEIEAFQDKTDFEGCYTGNRNCADRPGDIHQGSNGNLFYYVEDLPGKALSEWNLQGTPTCFLLKPNGLVAFNSAQDGGCDQLGVKLYEIFGSGGN